MDQSDIKAAIIREAPGFGDVWVDCFNWQQNGDIITAKARGKISEMCHQTMLKVGFKFVSGGRGNPGYFELVLKPEAEQNGPGRTHSPECGILSSESPLSLGSVFSRLENQLHNLAETGKRLTE